MQCSAFLAGALQRSRHSTAGSSSNSSGAIRALVIAPKTLLAHWEKELRVCGMGPRSHCFYGSSEGERSAALRAVTGRGGVLLTTYGMVLHNAAQLRAGLGTAARGELRSGKDKVGLESVCLALLSFWSQQCWCSLYAAAAVLPAVLPGVLLTAPQTLMSMRTSPTRSAWSHQQAAASCGITSSLMRATRSRTHARSLHSAFGSCVRSHV